MPDLKARLWFWWPFIAAPILIGTVAASLLLFWPKAEKVQVEDNGFGTIKKLSSLTNFRRAYLLANGGKEGLDALKTMQARGLFISGGRSVPFRSLKRRPDQSLTTLKFPDYDLTFGIDGDLVWQRIKVEGQAARYELKEGGESEGLHQLGEFFDPIMNVLLFEKGRIKKLSTDTWESQNVLRLDFQTESGIQITAYIDPHTMRPLARIENFADGMKREILFNEYFVIGGMQEPFLIETYVNGQLASRIEIEKSEHNMGIIPSVFEYPEELIQPENIDLPSAKL